MNLNYKQTERKKMTTKFLQNALLKNKKAKNALQKGFTLVELMVVIVIVVVIMIMRVFEINEMVVTFRCPDPLVE